jgi:hypothetical protein
MRRAGDGGTSMRGVLFSIALLSSGISAVFSLLGCFHTVEDCELNPKLRCGSWAVMASGTGGDGGTPSECIPSENNKPVDDACGLFVSSSQGQDSNAGTKGAPLKSLQQALDKANGRPVYACAEELSGSAKLAQGMVIFGGLDCAQGWAYVGGTTKSALTGDADQVALTITSTASKTQIADFAITAPSATTPGSSSIAVVVDGAIDVELLRCDLAAGDGPSGEAGTQLADDPSLNGEAGTNGAGACDLGAHTGPTGKTKMCPSGGMSVAGSGGDGGQLMMMTLQPAGSGKDGSPADPAQPTKGKGGVGEGEGSATSCDDGTSGASGAAGEAGAGATGIGNLTEGGYSGVKGSDGTAGKPGQGGGGGGGAKGGLNINCGGTITDVIGASGGSGGTGGCGGAGGGGGGAGGSSIALVSRRAQVKLTSVTLRAGKGGDGGKGGDAQGGGGKGFGGNPGTQAGTAKASCRGGDGGQGGPGGPGGGGQGGHSLGVAYTGSAPRIDPTQITTGAAGQGGPGGMGNSTADAGKGADGVAIPVQGLP